MTDKGNEFVFPRNSTSMSDNGGFPIDGLTKREIFSLGAMIGLLTSTEAADWKAEFPHLKKGELPSYEDIQTQVAKCSVEMANALLKALEEDKSK